MGQTEIMPMKSYDTSVPSDCNLRDPDPPPLLNGVKFFFFSNITFDFKQSLFGSHIHFLHVKDKFKNLNLLKGLSVLLVHFLAHFLMVK